jgi:arylsulfatase A-like enzyme
MPSCTRAPDIGVRASSPSLAGRVKIRFSNPPKKETSMCAHILALCLTTGAVLDSTDAAEPPPNVIIILTDDQGYHDLGCFGSTNIKTPHIDRMAKEGMRLTDFYAQAVCGPSRAALLTGCYPIRVAEPGNRKNQHTILHTNEVTIAEVLKPRGYATACIGKWHVGLPRGNGWDPETMPGGQGFDYFYGTPRFNGYTVRVSDTKMRSTIMRNDQVVVPAVQSWDHITQDYTREALAFIRKNRDRPFFLYLAHNMPHIPLGASEKFKGGSEYGPYGDAIEEIDWSTGQILDSLRELELDDNTLVVFTSDNGPWIEVTRGAKPGGRTFIPPEHSGTADPLRGYKMLTWEGGLRVPCVAWAPGKIPAGTTCGAVAATIDLLPTIAHLCGAELPRDRALDGHNVWPLLTGKTEAGPHDETGFFYYRYTALEAVRSGPWKLVLPRPEHPPWTGWSGRFVGSGVAEVTLFNLTDDIAEATNLAGEHPEVTARLQQKIEAARADLGDYNRIGRGARFFDEGPHRPDRWTKQTP